MEGLSVAVATILEAAIAAAAVPGEDPPLREVVLGALRQGGALPETVSERCQFGTPLRVELVFIDNDGREFASSEAASLEEAKLLAAEHFGCGAESGSLSCVLVKVDGELRWRATSTEEYVFGM